MINSMSHRTERVRYRISSEASHQGTSPRRFHSRIHNSRRGTITRKVRREMGSLHRWIVHQGGRRSRNWQRPWPPSDPTNNKIYIKKEKRKKRDTFIKEWARARFTMSVFNLPYSSMSSLVATDFACRKAKEASKARVGALSTT
jgi:hypothetical protein